ncbi:MAG: uroporphyrinogen-III synthase [Litorimonas sp.]
MTKTIWISRTQPSAENSAKLWENAGYKAIVAPLLNVIQAPHTPIEPSSDDILIFTSKNGVNAYQNYGFKTVQNVITVGDATARFARDIGFTNVTSARGTSMDVTRVILKNADIKLADKTRSIIHCAGKHIRGSICEDLQAAGYTARRDLYYQSEVIRTWPEIDYKALTHIAFYSPLAAQSFCALMSDMSSRPTSLDVHNYVFISISKAVDAALGNLQPAMRKIAQDPHEAAMLLA